MKIVSGGQTGVDRAALDAAIELGIPHGGWVPRGRIAEDGRIPGRYQMREDSSTEYARRTELNIRDSDGTLIITRGTFDGGTAFTARKARELGKPLLIIEDDTEAAADSVLAWLRENRIAVLNVAGPRESKSPGIHAHAVSLLRELLPRLQRGAAPAIAEVTPFPKEEEWP